MRMKTIGDVLKLCRANRYTYYNLGKDSKTDFRKLHRFAKKYADTPLFDHIYNAAIRILQLREMEIIKKTWAIEYVLDCATRNTYWTGHITERLAKEKYNE